MIAMMTGLVSSSSPRSASHRVSAKPELLPASVEFWQKVLLLLYNSDNWPRKSEPLRALSMVFSLHRLRVHGLRSCGALPWVRQGRWVKSPWWRKRPCVMERERESERGEKHPLSSEERREKWISLLPFLLPCFLPGFIPLLLPLLIFSSSSSPIYRLLSFFSQSITRFSYSIFNQSLRFCSFASSV